MSDNPTGSGAALTRWLGAAAVAALLVVPTGAMAAQRMVLGEYFTADW